MSFESPSSKAGSPRHTAAATPKRVAVLVDQIAETEALAGDLASSVQSTASVISALRSLGHQPVELSLEANKTDEWLRRLAAGGFDLAFNLCETVAGHAASEHLPAAVVELLNVPMTGASSATLLYCLDKDRCSAMLRAHGIPVPDWKLIGEHDPIPNDWNGYPAIVKPAAEDASNGVHPNSVVRSHAELVEAVERLRPNWGKLLVQEFVDGREINLAIVGAQVLPPAEIDFSTLPEGSPAIVSFEAKWMTGSAEDLGTRPVCPAPLEPEQVTQLQKLAGDAWEVMDGTGYARVDVRLTDGGAPYVIDINPNPDLAPDAGLARQAGAAGWSYQELIGRIVGDALAGNGRDGRLSTHLQQEPAGEERI